MTSGIKGDNPSLHVAFEDEPHSGKKRKKGKSHREDGNDSSHKKGSDPEEKKRRKEEKERRKKEEKEHKKKKEKSKEKKSKQKQKVESESKPQSPATSQPQENLGEGSGGTDKSKEGSEKVNKTDGQDDCNDTTQPDETKKESKPEECQERPVIRAATRKDFYEECCKTDAKRDKCGTGSDANTSSKKQDRDCRDACTDTRDECETNSKRVGCYSSTIDCRNRDKTSCRDKDGTGNDANSNCKKQCRDACTDTRDKCETNSKRGNCSISMGCRNQEKRCRDACTATKSGLLECQYLGLPKKESCRDLCERRRACGRLDTWCDQVRTERNDGGGSVPNCKSSGSFDERSQGKGDDSKRSTKGSSDEMTQLKNDLLALQRELDKLKECLRAAAIAAERNKCTLTKMKEQIRCNIGCCIPDFSRIREKLKMCHLMKIKLCREFSICPNRDRWRKDFECLMNELNAIKCELEKMRRDNKS